MPQSQRRVATTLLVDNCPVSQHRAHFFCDFPGKFAKKYKRCREAGQIMINGVALDLHSRVAKNSWKVIRICVW
jgi:hypothetical protein